MKVELTKRSMMSINIIYIYIYCNYTLQYGRWFLFKNFSFTLCHVVHVATTVSCHDDKNTSILL